MEKISSSSTASETENEFQNFIKLQYLMNRTATTCLRDMFKQEWTFRTRFVWQNSRSDAISFITGPGEKVYRQSKRIQKDLIDSGNLDLWDIPLLVQAIKIFDSSMTKLTTKMRNHGLDLIKEQRNKLAHHGNTNFSSEQFKEIWKQVTETLLLFGVPASVLNEARTNPLIIGTKENVTKGSTNPNIIRARELKEIGNKLFKDEKYSQAIEKYTEAIKFPGLPFEDLAALYSNRSISFLRVEDFEYAKNDAKGVILVHPTWSKGYFRLGSAYESLGKFLQALKNYELALELDPQNYELKDCRDHCKYIVNKRARDEHLDPLALHTSVVSTVEKMRGRGFETSPHHLLNNQRLNKMMGLAPGICGEGHRYVTGDGRPRDYEQAARCYAEAAAKGSAEGLYNLALLTREGKGVRRDYQEGMRLLREAAAQSHITEMHGNKFSNLGVAEAEHSLGLAYAEGVGVPQCFTTAIDWYERAIKHGSGSSCNNLALMYGQGDGVRRDISKAIAIWKIGCYYKTPRAMENLALEYLSMCNIENGWKWHDYAIAEGGSITMGLRKSEFVNILGPNPYPPIDKDKLWEELRDEVSHGPLKHLVCTDEPILTLLFGGNLIKIPKEAEEMVKAVGGDTYKSFLVVSHRRGFIVTAQVQKSKKEDWNVTAGKIAQKGITDLFGLKPIFIKEMTVTEDHVFEGFVIKLTIIEDAIVGRPSIPLIVEDEKKDVQRVFIYNYPQEKNIQSKLGFGCKISIVNPYFRIANDQLAAIRVDDPTTIFFHSDLTDKTRCRFCGKGNSSVMCRKCKRCMYCSKKCLLDDAKFWQHDFICKKRI